MPLEKWVVYFVSGLETRLTEKVRVDLRCRVSMRMHSTAFAGYAEASHGQPYPSAHTMPSAERAAGSLFRFDPVFLRSLMCTPVMADRTAASCQAGYANVPCTYMQASATRALLREQVKTLSSEVIKADRVSLGGR